MVRGGIEFVKGHGAGNDFVLLPDLEGRLDLTEARVRAVCDRRHGLGADGVLRVVRTHRVADASASVVATAWFMDYRNADGSIAEMCGNGARVFVRYLADAGLIGDDQVIIGTRAGPRRVRLNADETVTVEMGPVRVDGTSSVTLDETVLDGVAVDVGNPHLVCRTPDGLDALNLTAAPLHDHTRFPAGLNTEFVSIVADDHIRMRVYERGVGESHSCGTGAVAAAAALHSRGPGNARGAVTVDVPGGRLRVRIDQGVASLTGPAVLVAGGRLDHTWWLAR